MEGDKSSTLSQDIGTDLQMRQLLVCIYGQYHRLLHNTLGVAVSRGVIQYLTSLAEGGGLQCPVGVAAGCCAPQQQAKGCTHQPAAWLAPAFAAPATLASCTSQYRITHSAFWSNNNRPLMLV